MAVQKSKSSRSKRGMRRSNDNIKKNSLSIDRISGEIHLRHNITHNGFYKGFKI